MQLEDIMWSEVSQAQKDKGCMFSLIHGRYKRWTSTQTQEWSYTHSNVEHVSNSGTTLWNLGKEGK
jgi:hypothetical protein